MGRVPSQARRASTNVYFLWMLAMAGSLQAHGGLAAPIYDQDGKRLEQFAEADGKRRFVLTLDVFALTAELERQNGAEPADSDQSKARNYLIAHPMTYAMAIGDKLIKDTIKDSITYLAHDVIIQEYFIVHASDGEAETQLVSTLTCGWECGLRIYMPKGDLTPWFRQERRQEFASVQ